MTQAADLIAASELAAWGVNDADLYRQCGRPLVENMARKMAAGTFAEALAVKGYSYWAEAAARSYCKAHGGCWSAVFSVATRRAAAALALDHYGEEIEDRTADLLNAKLWPLSAIRAANLRAGFFFFERKTMACWGDTLKSWKVECEGGRVFLVRVKASSRSDQAGLVARWEFDPSTGRLAPVEKFRVID